MLWCAVQVLTANQSLEWRPVERLNSTSPAGSPLPGYTYYWKLAQVSQNIYNSW